ncbi:glycosyltransferase family 2 protein [Oxalicibacterium solurbis]|uniref:Glycosyl transferase n=1 Tax=Oxalicibacterium solurbis TaxID=69280 RepID=A0A8J3F673_9BURK|nr:glycosyltransferase family 2 protein [Oxalicibacterium solurbis]GGI54286.1 glycosyl transferase [Oxalicibacterium solurbis]
MDIFNPVVLIPVYDHEHAIGDVVRAVLAHDVPCMLIDDGSSPMCAAVLDELAREYRENVSLVRHEKNRGKGDAVMTGIHSAEREGYTHALQIDADGQHRVEDIPGFLAAARQQPHAVIAGYPVYDESVPAIRLYGRYATHIWVWINTLSMEIRDSMCGFRVYPIAPVTALAARQKLGGRMHFDTDILVRLFWDGISVVNLPTRVVYPADGVSHFRVWLDNILIARMHATLFFGMLPRIPRLLARKWRAQ